MAESQMTFADALIKHRSAAAGPLSEPAIAYIERGDHLTIHFENEPYFAERVDELLTVYRSMDTGDLVGCKIKGVSLLARNVSSMIAIEDGDVAVNLLLLNAAGAKPHSKYYYTLCEKAKVFKLRVPENLIRKAA